MATSNCSFFCLGLGLGAAVALLFAPKPGEEMRGELRARAEERGDRLRQRGGELRDRAEGILEKGRGVLDEQKGQLTVALEAGRAAYREAGRREEADASAESSLRSPGALGTS